MPHLIFLTAADHILGDVLSSQSAVMKRVGFGEDESAPFVLKLTSLINLEARLLLAFAGPNIPCSLKIV